MKKLYVAIFFLIFAMGLCVFEQVTVETAYTDTTHFIDTALNQVEKQDFKNAAQTCKNLSEYWDKKYPYMTAMIDHGALDDAGVTINSLFELAQNESDSLEDELINAKNQMKSIRDNQKITFGNIF